MNSDEQHTLELHFQALIHRADAIVTSVKAHKGSFSKSDRALKLITSAHQKLIRARERTSKSPAKFEAWKKVKTAAFEKKRVALNKHILANVKVLRHQIGLIAPLQKEAKETTSVESKAVENTTIKPLVTELDEAIIGTIRDKLLTASAVEPRKKNEERRQHLRARCSLTVNFQIGVCLCPFELMMEIG